jgi:pheromone a factor receptor
MLTHHDTNKSRFLRLYLLCAICIMGIFPLEVYIDYLAISAGLLSFDWTQTHYPTAYEWNSIVFIPSGGAILFDRYIWLAGGLLIFLTFGFGRDATKTYRELLVRLGLARFFPSLLRTGQTSSPAVGGSSGAWMSSMTSSMSGKIRLIFPMRGGGSTGGQSTRVTASTISSIECPLEKSMVHTTTEEIC